jgi:hypothetical protein
VAPRRSDIQKAKQPAISKNAASTKMTTLVVAAETIALIARAIEAERHCCRFLRFAMTVEPSANSRRSPLSRSSRRSAHHIGDDGSSSRALACLGRYQRDAQDLLCSSDIAPRVTVRPADLAGAFSQRAPPIHRLQ